MDLDAFIGELHSLRNQYGNIHFLRLVVQADEGSVDVPLDKVTVRHDPAYPDTTTLNMEGDFG